MKRVVTLLICLSLVASICSCKAEIDYDDTPSFPDEKVEFPTSDVGKKDDAEGYPEPLAPDNQIDHRLYAMSQEEFDAYTALYEENPDYKIAFYIYPLFSSGFWRLFNADMSRYPGRCVYMTYPEDYIMNRDPDAEDFIKAGLEMVEDNDVKVFVMYLASRGAEELLDRIKECRPDILTIGLYSNQRISAVNADIVLQFDSIAMIKKMVEQAHQMGVETLIHFWDLWTEADSFDDFERAALIGACIEFDIEFVDMETHEYSMWPRADVFWSVNKYGNNTCFYYPRGGDNTMFVYAIEAEYVFIQKGDYINVYATIPFFLGIEISDERFLDFDWIIAQITSKFNEYGASGRFAFTPAPFSMVSITAAIEYAMAYCSGIISDKVSPETVQMSFQRALRLYGFDDVGFELRQTEPDSNVFRYATDYRVY